jgi:hypothetical protein
MGTLTKHIRFDCSEVAKLTQLLLRDSIARAFPKTDSDTEAARLLLFAEEQQRSFRTRDRMLLQQIETALKRCQTRL